MLDFDYLLYEYLAVIAASQEIGLDDPIQSLPALEFYNSISRLLIKLSGWLTIKHF